MLRSLASLLLALVFLFAAPAGAQQLPVGQGEAEYEVWLARGPAIRGQVLSFEMWQDAAGVRGVLPTWQILRTASMWRECGGQPFEVPPFTFWPDMVKTLRFIRDRVRPAVGPVEAVSGFRNPALNDCAGGAASSAHLDYFALDLVPLEPIDRRALIERICPVHARYGRAAGAGLGFYAFTRFHVDTRGFRRWGGAGPNGNESPCAVLERGGDPLAPPLPSPALPVGVAPSATPPGALPPAAVPPPRPEPPPTATPPPQPPRQPGLPG